MPGNKRPTVPVGAANVMPVILPSTEVITANSPVALSKKVNIYVHDLCREARWKGGNVWVTFVEGRWIATLWFNELIGWDFVDSMGIPLGSELLPERKSA